MEDVTHLKAGNRLRNHRKRKDVAMTDKSDSISRRGFLGRVGAGTLGVLAAGTAVQHAFAQEAGEWKRTSDKKIRIGVVGGGFGCAFQWHQHPNCIVEAVSDLQPARRRKLMHVYSCKKSYESLEKLVFDDKLDAVAVFTDAPSHGRHVLECMKRGKHVISAVPAAMNLEDCQAMKEMKEKTGLKYMMAETSYFHRGVIQARRIYKRGLQRKLLYTEGEYYHHAVTRVGSWKKWRYALPPMLYPTHSTAYYVGVSKKRLTKVSCVGWLGTSIADRNYHKEWQENQYNNPFANESALFRTSEDTMCRINVFWWGHAGGETGRWIWESRPKKGVKVSSHVPLPPGMARGGHGGSHGPLTNEFIMALLEDREPVIDIYEALAMTAPGIVAHQSAFKDGEQLKIPNFDKA